MYLKASICNKIKLFLHDSTLHIPPHLSIMFVNREVLDCSAREEIIILERTRGCNWHAINSLMYNNCFVVDC